MRISSVYSANIENRPQSPVVAYGRPNFNTKDVFVSSPTFRGGITSFSARIKNIAQRLTLPFDKLDILRRMIAKKQKVVLIFDYDGTLTPWRKDGVRVQISEKLRNALENLTTSDFVKICVVTGRKTEEFKKVTKMNTADMTIYGLHGGEVEQNNTVVSRLNDEKMKATVKKFYDELVERCKGLEGLTIKNNTYTVPMNYRSASEEHAKKAVSIFNELIEKYRFGEEFIVQRQKKILELAPSQFTKNSAVKEIAQANPGYVPFYFGDDTNDIPAFEEVLKHSGYAVGIKPLPFKTKNIISFKVTQKKLEEFFINLNNQFKPQINLALSA